MVGEVVAVLALFEEVPELEGLVGFVMVHRPKVQPAQAQTGADQENGDEERGERPLAHLAGVPKISTST